LIIDTNFDNNSPNLVTIQAKFLPTGIAGANHLNGVAIVGDESNSPDLQASCQGDLYDSATNKEILRQGRVYSMICRRPAKNNPKEAFWMLGKEILATPTTISVATDPGTIVFAFPTILKPSKELDFSSRLATKVSGRLNFTLGGPDDRKPGNDTYRRIATYLFEKVGSRTTITGWFPNSCYNTLASTCKTGEEGSWKGDDRGVWNEADRTISLNHSKLTYGDTGLLYDDLGKAPVGYISFDP
jgi:hypothetical protein